MQFEQTYYSFENFDLLYLHDPQTGQISMVLLPKNMPHRYGERKDDLQVPELRRCGLATPAWSVGSLCHLALRSDAQSNGAGETLLAGASTRRLRFAGQAHAEFGDRTEICTELRTDDGLAVRHTASHFPGEDGLEVRTVFENRSGHPVQLDLLTSFALDNLTPFAIDDAPRRMKLHRFYGGWSHEGRPRTDTLEQLSLERTWYTGRPESERFGVVGSFPVDRYFPFAAVEDSGAEVFWGAQLACGSSWQMEFCRTDDCLVLAGGLADCEFGAWYKCVALGESFAAPKAFVSVGRSLSQVCGQLTAMHQKYVRLQPAQEQSLPLICNEWCTSWGHPNEREILALAEKLQGTPVEYLVIDAGWTKTNNDHLGQGGNGDWILDREKFPNGLRPLSRKLRGMGLRLGVWFEFEATTLGAALHGSAYDSWHLTRGGRRIVTGDDRSFLDFRKPEVTAYLKEKVSDFIRENELGYVKVDYNGSIGIGCDGAESLGEGLRQQMEAVREFFRLLRRENPDLVIESCSSGGHRLEPSIMDITALSSFTDAHECPEVPLLAANVDHLILPRQNQIWCTLDDTFAPHRLRHCLATGFLGRMCISGDILTLSREQWDMTRQAMDFYVSAEPILEDCSIQVCQKLLDESIRYPRGMQAVLLTGRNGGALLVCHSFSDPAGCTLHVPCGFPRVERVFGPDTYYHLCGGALIIGNMPEFEAFALLLA